MRVSLLSPYPDITNYGLRTLAAVLQRAGHETRVICMPDFAGDGESTHVVKSELRATTRASSPRWWTSSADPTSSASR
jgi:hypothetical protein